MWEHIRAQSVGAMLTEAAQQSAAMLAEIVRPLQQSSILRTAGHAEVAPPSHFTLSESDRRALHRAAMVIVVGMLVILAMELAPEVSSRFGTWLGIAGGLTTLVWYVIN